MGCPRGTGSTEAVQKTTRQGARGKRWGQTRAEENPLDNFRRPDHRRRSTRPGRHSGGRHKSFADSTTLPLGVMRRAACSITVPEVTSSAETTPTQSVDMENTVCFLIPLDKYLTSHGKTPHPSLQVINQITKANLCISHLLNAPIASEPRNQENLEMTDMKPSISEAKHAIEELRLQITSLPTIHSQYFTTHHHTPATASPHTSNTHIPNPTQDTNQGLFFQWKT